MRGSKTRGNREFSATEPLSGDNGLAVRSTTEYSERYGSFVGHKVGTWMGVDGHSGDAGKKDGPPGHCQAQIPPRLRTGVPTCMLHRRAGRLLGERRAGTPILVGTWPTGGMHGVLHGRISVSNIRPRQQTPRGQSLRDWETWGRGRMSILCMSSAPNCRVLGVEREWWQPGLLERFGEVCGAGIRLGHSSLPTTLAAWEVRG